MTTPHKLAQPLRLEQTAQVAGAEVYLHAVGGDVLVQLHVASDGVPSGEPLATARLPAASAAGQTHRVQWPPIWMPKGQECALVIVAGDTDTQMGIGQIGAPDISTGPMAGQYMGAQPWQIGALRVLGGDGAWITRPDTCLNFALLAAVYPNETETVDMGSVNVTGASDLAVRADADVPEPGAACTFALRLDDGRVFDVAADQRVTLNERYSGAVAVQATLRRGPSMGASLLPGATLVHGKVGTEGDYVSPWISASGGADLRVEMLALIPAGAAVKVQSQIEGQADWTDVPYIDSSPATRGTLEMVYGRSGISTQRLRVRLVLTGTPAARPMVTNLRVVVV